MSGRGVKRKQSEVQDLQAEQATRRAKLEGPKGQLCQCQYEALPQHIREVIMSAETTALTSLLRLYHASLTAHDTHEIYALHAPDAIVLFPNTPTPAETEDSIRTLYAAQLSTSGMLHVSPEAGTAPGKGKGASIAAAEPAPSSATGGGGGGGGGPSIVLEVQEMRPMSPDWAFARFSLTLRPPTSVLASSPITTTTTTTTPAASLTRKIYATFIFRKLSLGAAEETRGWRIARSIFTLASSGVQGGGVEGTGGEVRKVAMAEGPPSSSLARRQRGGKSGGQGGRGGVGKR